MEHPSNLFGYEVVDSLGEGAGSRIYVVTTPDSGQLYALKHVVRKAEKDVRFQEQLENEFDVARRFNHPALRKAFEMRDNRTLLRKPTESVLLMELFDGTPLEGYQPKDPVEILDIMIRVAEALASLHGLGFVHCDLKPNNILLNQAGQVKVIDFGQACVAGSTKVRIQGTPDYMAPEQVKCLPVTPRTDVYSFGATLYALLTGKPIPTLYTVHKQGSNSLLSHEMIPSPHQIDPSIPENLSNLVMECVYPSPGKRPGDMADLARRMEVIRHVILRQTGVVGLDEQAIAEEAAWDAAS
jgi:eukaryotic-like serine/threonine-protein kinase